MSPILRRFSAERVRITVARLGTVEAVVARAVPGAAELVLLGHPPVPVRFLHRCPATVEPEVGDDGLDGMLLAVPSSAGRVRDDILHFVHIAAGVLPSQRRAFARVAAIRPVTILPNRFEQGWLNASTRDVSAGGVLIAGGDGLELGERLRLRLELDPIHGNEELLDLQARVVRAEESGLTGVALEDLDERTRDQIVRFVFARQRAALAQLRDLAK